MNSRHILVCVGLTLLGACAPSSPPAPSPSQPAASTPTRPSYTIHRTSLSMTYPDAVVRSELSDDARTIKTIIFESDGKTEVGTQVWAIDKAAVHFHPVGNAKPVDLPAPGSPTLAAANEQGYRTSRRHDDENCACLAWSLQSQTIWNCDSVQCVSDVLCFPGECPDYDDCPTSDQFCDYNMDPVSCFCDCSPPPPDCQPVGVTCHPTCVGETVYENVCVQETCSTEGGGGSGGGSNSCNDAGGDCWDDLDCCSSSCCNGTCSDDACDLNP